LVALVAQEGRTILEADPGATTAGRAELFCGRGSIEVERVRLPWEPGALTKLRGPEHAATDDQSRRRGEP